MSFPLCFACQYAERYPNTTTKRCAMRRARLDQCSGQLAEITSAEKALDLIEQMLTLSEEHDRLLDVLDIEPDPDSDHLEPTRTRMTLLTKAGRCFKITVEELLCRRCRLPRRISSDHERGCTWHPSNRVAV